MTIDEPGWPQEALNDYERIEVLGKGSFGMVWMAQRQKEERDEFDDEYVAIKIIRIKDEKGAVYAEREISILEELRHPHVIRLIRHYKMRPEDHDALNARLVVMQLARGPNLHQLVIKRGCLGLPLSRLVSRQLIAAVSYLHGRAVIHRDIKPSNCILHRIDMHPTDDYDWTQDDAIWSSAKDGMEAVEKPKWKLMLVDFGFARALEKSEIVEQTRKMRNSIVFEKDAMPRLSKVIRKSAAANGIAAAAAAAAAAIEEGDEGEEDDDLEEDLKQLEAMAESAARRMKTTAYEPTNELENKIMGAEAEQRQRKSIVSVKFEEDEKEQEELQPPRRTSTARQKLRSMSALGTKAYAAPEIRKQLRVKTQEDFSKANAAMTECVADYGMIVDSYSVGWTLRVAMTGVPPNFTISEYMQQRETVVLADDTEDEKVDSCCCIKGVSKPAVKIRDPSMIPYDATLLIAQMTEKNPEDRMTVREAQLHPWISGSDTDEPYTMPEGDVPSQHGDPVIPLKCASALSNLTVEYHMH